MPKTRQAFWREKFERNVARDARDAAALRRLGWKVVTVWECECRHPSKLAGRLARLLKPIQLPLSTAIEHKQARKSIGDDKRRIRKPVTSASRTSVGGAGRHDPKRRSSVRPRVP
jgi:hypothetical protein